MKVAVKERILNAAGELFYQQGYQATGINQIIAESKVAKASFYDHFPTKEDLCVSYLSLESKRWIDVVNGHVETNITERQKIIALFDHLIAFSTKKNFRGCGFLNVLAEIGSGSYKIKSAVQQHKLTLLKFIEIKTSLAVSKPIYLLYESALMESQVFAAIWPIELAKKMALNILKTNKS